MRFYNCLAKVSRPRRVKLSVQRISKIWYVLNSLLDSSYELVIGSPEKNRIISVSILRQMTNEGIPTSLDLCQHKAPGGADTDYPVEPRDFLIIPVEKGTWFSDIPVEEGTWRYHDTWVMGCLSGNFAAPSSQPQVGEKLLYYPRYPRKPHKQLKKKPGWLKASFIWNK